MDRRSLFQIIERVSVVDVQVKQGMTMQDIIDTAERYPEIHLRNMAEISLFN